MSARGFLRGVVVAVILVFLLLHTAVQLGRDFAVQWLLDQGASSARIHSVSINWFTGRVSLQGVSVITPEQPSLRLDKLLIDLDYGALAEQRILISDLMIDGVALYLHEQQGTDPRQFFLGPVALPGASSETAEEEPSEPSAWQFGLAHLSVSDFNWRSQLIEGDHLLLIESGELDTFYTWQEEAVTNLVLRGALNGADFDLSTQGQPLPETKRSELHLKLDNLPLHSFTAPFVPELQATLSTDIVLTLVADEQISISQRGRIRIDDFNWKQSHLDVSQRKLTWQGKTDVKMRAGKPESVMVDGDLKLSATGVTGEALKLLLESGGWQGRTELAFGEVGLEQVGVNGQLNLSSLDFAGEGMNVQLNKGSWQGDTGLNFNSEGVDKVDVKGQLKAGQLLYQMPDRLQARVNAADWQGGLALALQQQPVTIRGQQGQLALAGVDVKALKGDQTLVSLTQAQLSGIGLDLPQKLALGGLSATDLIVAPQTDATLATLNLNISDVDFSVGELLAINRVELHNLQLQEQLDAQKKPVNVERLQQGIASLSPAPESADPDASAPAEDSASALRIQVNEVVVNGDSKVLFADNGTSPPFSSEILIDRVSLNGLDTGSKKPAQFDLQMRLNSFTTLNLAGNTNLVGGGDNASWKGSVKQLELPRLSPYSIQYTGYYLQNGQLQLDSSGKLTDGKINGKNEIKIHRLEVEPADQEQMAKFSKQLSMPLGTAISVLQDGDDNIDLDVPVSGSLDDPDFGLQSIVTRLAGKGLKQAAFSILLKSLQPYGTLISLAASAAKDGSFITLDPVVFAPGSAELDDYAQGYLTKIEAMMGERKGMRLNICGQVVQQDQSLIRTDLEEKNKKREKPLTPEQLAAQEKQLMIGLAQQRADRVKQQLTRKIPGERLFSCFPVPSLDDPEAKPGVTLGL